MGAIRTVAVVGAGTMGQGIAQVSATAGYRTLLFDSIPGQVHRAWKAIEKNLENAVVRGKLTEAQSTVIVQNLVPAEHLNELVADLVIEAAVEKLDVKQDILAHLEGINGGSAILATNTSSISISKIAGALKTPSQCIGLHFFNPADRMKLVEIIATDQTDPVHIETLKAFAARIGKTAVLAKDSPGFIVNRVARHFYLESLKIHEEGGDVRVIDALMRSAGFRMGPFELMDLIGVDVNYAVTQSVYEGFNHAHKFKPSIIQEQMVSQGNLGRKTGKGFYEYEEKD